VVLIRVRDAVAVVIPPVASGTMAGKDVGVVVVAVEGACAAVRTNLPAVAVRVDALIVVRTAALR
jgi:hypothetical protein